MLEPEAQAAPEPRPEAVRPQLPGCVRAPVRLPSPGVELRLHFPGTADPTERGDGPRN